MGKQKVFTRHNLTDSQVNQLIKNKLIDSAESIEYVASYSNVDDIIVGNKYAIGVFDTMVFSSLLPLGVYWFKPILKERGVAPTDWELIHSRAYILVDKVTVEHTVLP